jgi:6-phosphogluconolactonase (cycloisomerase 2 family)
MTEGLKQTRGVGVRALRCAVLVALAGAAGAIGVGSASAHSTWKGSRVVGHVYVNENTIGVNTIAGFDRHADGSLTPIPGSPFAAGGAGTGVGIASQGALQLSSDGRYLLAVDAGSNQISVLQIKRGGRLWAVRGGPVASNGVDPVSIAVHDDLVYVANAGPGGNNYTGFRFWRGHLQALDNSTVALPDGSQPGDVLFNGDGRKLVGTRVGTSLIDSFTVGHDGRLSAGPNSPIPAQGPGPFGSEFRPTNPSQLFVSNAHGGTDNGTVSAFSDAWDGTLTSIGVSPFADHQTAPCWVEISHDGRYLFTVNTAVATISSYSIARDGSLTLLGSTPINAPVGSPEDARLSPDGSTLWVVDPTANTISGFSVNGGSLTELSSSPTLTAAGAAPTGIVVT